MEISAHESFFGLFRQIDISPHIGILKTHLTGLSVRCLCPVFFEKQNLCIHFRMSDRTGAVGPVDPEETHGKTAL